MTRLATPAFWQQQFHPLALLLWPVGEIYKAVTHARLRHHGPHAGVPAICIGNVNVGGTGKTPIVQYAVQELQKLGRTPHIIMLGYGGQAQETTRVDLALHDAHDVGDEALLHAGIAPTWVGKDRHQSAQAAIAAGADIIVMDDGMQSPSIQPSTRWLVLDAARGIGNGYGIPAGPLREDLSHGLRRVDAIILVGEGDFMPQTDKPVLRVKIETDEVSRQNLKDKLIYAFAGIGQPEKLVFSLRAAGLEVAGARGFPDHHQYSLNEITALRRRATSLDAQLVTTQKDYVRLPADWREGITPVNVKMTWDQPEKFQNLLESAMHAKP